MSQTEDDTFRILKRPTFDEMTNIVVQWSIKNKKATDEEKHAFLESYGWTADELLTRVNEIRAKWNAKREGQE